MSKYYLPPTVEDEESGPESSSDDSILHSDRCGSTLIYGNLQPRDQQSRTTSSSTINSTAEINPQPSSKSANPMDADTWNRILKLHEQYRQSHSHTSHPLNTSPINDRRTNERKSHLTLYFTNLQTLCPCYLPAPTPFTLPSLNSQNNPPLTNIHPLVTPSCSPCPSPSRPQISGVPSIQPTNQPTNQTKTQNQTKPNQPTKKRTPKI
jgi:hypothetical protein